jgi:hypothetical protein
MNAMSRSASLTAGHVRRLGNGVGRRGMATCEDLVGSTSRDVYRAHAFLSAGVAIVDRVLGYVTNTDADAQVTMALTETSHATHRALVKLAEVTEMLADLSDDHPGQRVMPEDVRAVALRRL